MGGMFKGQGSKFKVKGAGSRSTRGGGRKSTKYKGRKDKTKGRKAKTRDFRTKTRIMRVLAWPGLAGRWRATGCGDSVTKKTKWIYKTIGSDPLNYPSRYKGEDGEDVVGGGRESGFGLGLVWVRFNSIHRRGLTRDFH